MQLIDIELGSVAVNAQAGGEPKQYKKIIGELSGALVAALDLGREAAAEVEPEPAPEAEEINNEAADVVLASFSRAMDAVDKNDVREAKKNLQQVQKIDKTNEAAKYYLNKLQALSPKFRVEMVEYTTPYNAATLGFMDKMKIYSWSGAPLDTPGIETSAGGAQLDNNYWVMDKQSTTYIGFSLPLGGRFGLGAGFSMSGQDLKASPGDAVVDPPDLSFPANVDVYPAEGSDGIQSFLSNIGGYISFGARLTDWMSVGTSLMGWYTSAGPGYGNTVDEGFFFSIYPGLAFQVPGSSFAADINVAYTSFTMYYADFVKHEVVLGSLPLIIDGSLTYGLLNDRLFLGLKGISDIYYNARSGHALRLIPMVEVWPLTFLSIRGGYEYSHLSLNGEFKLAHGVVGGAYLKNLEIRYQREPYLQAETGTAAPGCRCVKHEAAHRHRVQSGLDGSEVAVFYTTAFTTGFDVRLMFVYRPHRVLLWCVY